MSEGDNCQKGSDCYSGWCLVAKGKCVDTDFQCGTWPDNCAGEYCKSNFDCASFDCNTWYRSCYDYVMDIDTPKDKPCSVDSDCIKDTLCYGCPLRFCSKEGICVDESELSCTKNVASGYKRCNDVECIEDADCVSGICDRNICSDYYSFSCRSDPKGSKRCNGVECSRDNDCESNICFNTICSS